VSVADNREITIEKIRLTIYRVGKKKSNKFQFFQTSSLDRDRGRQEGKAMATLLLRSLQRKTVDPKFRGRHAIRGSSPTISGSQEPEQSPELHNSADAVFGLTRRS
jgi:hypothetical protein